MSEETNKHLTYFKVENFKCFDSFEMEDIGQFNLILGDNNVGKTSVLEALMFDENLGQWLGYLDHFLMNRNMGDKLHEINFIEQFQNKNKQGKGFKITANSLQKKYSLFLQVVDIASLSSKNIESLRSNIFSKEIPREVILFKNNKTINYSTYNYTSHKNKISNYTPFVFSNALYNNDLVDFYSDNFQKSKISKIELIKNIQTFIPTLEDFEISTTAIPNKTIIICRLKDIDDILPLSMFGDGTVKLFRMLAEISNCSNSRLMIDEIDSGIHWSRYKDYWKTIIKAAANNNVQIFATTHSWECLKYLKEVLEEEDMKQYQGKTRSYTLVKQPNSDHVKAFKYSFPEFEFALERDIEIRGER